MRTIERAINQILIAFTLRKIHFNQKPATWWSVASQPILQAYLSKISHQQKLNLVNGIKLHHVSEGSEC